MMFRDKTFNIAFLISLSWHVFCMFCFTIVVLPASFPINKISNISFLGPILEKTAFEMMLEKKIQFKRTSYKDIMNLNNVFLSRNERMPDSPKFDNSFLETKEEKVKVSANDLFGDFKVIPPFLQNGLAAVQERVPQALSISPYGGDFLLEGPLSKREILFKPEVPVIAKRIEVGQESFAVELKFKASASGKIEEVALLASSGYPDVDMAAINYIKGFQFSPVSSPEKYEWNKVKLNLKSK